MTTHLARMVLAVLVLAVLSTRAMAQDLEAVIEWNRILQTTVAGTPTPTVFFTRPYAMTSVAVFDALNSIDRTYQPYVIEVNAAPNASRAAAVAQAAHDVLVAHYPGQQAALDAALASTLNRLPADAAQEGARVGAATARATLDARAADGWNRQPSAYVVPNLPGFYRITPPQNATVTFTHYPDVQPFIMRDRLQFRAGPPPALTSAHYAADYNEVKALGRVTGSTRTAEQTSIAQRWAAVGTSIQNQMVWQNVFRDLARRFGLSALDAARGYALINLTVHDALLLSFDGKFVYGLWRPVTAIQAGDLDGNAATDPDPTWLPLLATPPYPTYPGNMTCIAAAYARALDRIFGRNDIPFTVTWTGTGGATDITRPYSGFRELADEQARSRVYGGIHFEFDQQVSFGICTPLADYAVDNYLRARFPR